ncbi:MAG: Holliday junction branch migration protein RuvA [Candidatus Kerfeldbacteria bacterium]|nr:Holliday junction branch migration protein RuvA [Candidatus Kerfeldbacteria bacterium]
MIACITGTVDYIHPNGKHIVVLVHDIGYSIAVPATVLEQCRLHDTITLYTYHHVREAAVELYGFLARPDLAMFEQLLSVSGVGPKVGVAIIAHVSLVDLVTAIQQRDPTLFVKVPGVGKKIAERIVLELHSNVSTESLVNNPGSSISDALAALESLGYSGSESLSALQTIDKTWPVSQQVRAALQQLGKRPG